MKILIALGGNAILRRGAAGTAEEQYEVIRKTCKHLVKILRAGHDIVITHGNGPQVGDILLAYESAKEILPQMPLDVCGAQSQGMIGYMLQQSLENELKIAGIQRSVVTVVTQAVVDKSDPAFSSPTKPVGPFYSRREAEELRKERGWAVVQDGARGFRRVFPSPSPTQIVEFQTIRRLFENGVLTIAAGGGGIPVVLDSATGTRRGVEAVIDKDLSASLLARLLGVDLLMILSDVEGVFIGYGTEQHRLLRRVTVPDARKYLLSGEFPPGSMGPKVEAALRFVEESRRQAVITSVELAEEAVNGNAGTTILPS